MNEDTNAAGDGGGRLLRGWLTHRRLPLYLALLAVILTLPSLGVGWVADDHYHRLRLVGASLLPGLNLDPNELFTFAGGDLEENARSIDLGCWPWWTLKNLRAAFWRPLTVLTHRLDYFLWPDWPVFMHAQSILWFAALIFVIALFYRRVMGMTWVAGLAALFYAIDDARGMPVGFLANRNAVIAAFFGVSAILAHHKWRGDGWRAGALWGPGLLLAALLSAEAGLGALAYIAAYGFFVDKGSRRQRLASLLPYAVVVVGWRLVWSHLGYGVWGIGLYVDPVVEPLRYLVSALDKAPVYLLGQWTLPLSDLYVLALEFDLAWILTLLSIVAVGLIALIVAPFLRTDNLTDFWVVGMLLSLVPICATFPSDRMLFFVGIGAFALLAQFLGAVIRQVDRPARAGGRSTRRVATFALGLFFVAVHGLFAPVMLALRSGMPVGPKSFLESIHVHVPLDTSVERKSLVIVNAPIAFAGGYVPIRNAVDGKPVPAHTRTLAPHQAPVVVRRSDTRTLVIRPNRGFIRSAWDQLGRSLHHPLSVGERVELTGMTAEVTALTKDNRPAEVTFQFEVPLEDDSLCWLYWNGETYDWFTPPHVGETVTLTSHGAVPET